MSKRVVVIIVVCLVFRASIGQTVQQQQTHTSSLAELAVTATVSQQTFSLGAPVIVELSFKNNGSRAIDWVSRVGDPGYRTASYSLTVDGVAVPKTAFHRRISGDHIVDDDVIADGGSNFTFELQPGQKVGSQIDLTKLFEIKKPGVYMFTATKKSDDNSSVKISTPLTFEVIAK